MNLYHLIFTKEGLLVIRTDKRIIKFNKKCIIQKPGIHYIEMNHKNNVQTSLEEIDTVIDLMKQMIGSEFNDNGKKRELNVKDFLIISPYLSLIHI